MPESVTIVTGVSGQCIAYTDRITYATPNDLSQLVRAIERLAGEVHDFAAQTTQDIRSLDHRTRDLADEQRNLSRRIDQLDRTLNAIGEQAQALGRHLGSLTQSFGQASDTLETCATAIDEQRQARTKWFTEMGQAQERLQQRVASVGQSIRVSAESQVKAIAAAGVAMGEVVAELHQEVKARTEDLSLRLNAVRTAVETADERAGVAADRELDELKKIHEVDQDAAKSLIASSDATRKVRDLVGAAIADEEKRRSVQSQEHRIERSRELVAGMAHDRAPIPVGDPLLDHLARSARPEPGSAPLAPPPRDANDELAQRSVVVADALLALAQTQDAEPGATNVPLVEVGLLFQSGRYAEAMAVLAAHPGLCGHPLTSSLSACFYPEEAS